MLNALIRTRNSLGDIAADCANAGLAVNAFGTACADTAADQASAASLRAYFSATPVTQVNPASIVALQNTIAGLKAQLPAMVHVNPSMAGVVTAQITNLQTQLAQLQSVASKESPSVPFAVSTDPTVYTTNAYDKARNQDSLAADANAGRIPPFTQAQFDAAWSQYMQPGPNFNPDAFNRAMGVGMAVGAAVGASPVQTSPGSSSSSNPLLDNSPSGSVNSSLIAAQNAAAGSGISTTDIVIGVIAIGAIFMFSRGGRG